MTNDSRHEDEVQQYEVLSGKEMRERYNLTAENRPTIILNPENVPDAAKPLIPYAEKWGISDDLIRSAVLNKATIEELKELVRFMDGIDFPPIEAWLIGPEASGPDYSDEYIAITCLFMADSSAVVRLELAEELPTD